MNNEDIPESAKMEEGMMASTGVPTTTETSMNSSAASSTNKRLSTVSKMYDTSGKGELDDVQLAMRNMDQTGRGYLTNDKVYGLMQEQLKMQKSMFQMKKIIIGLMVFVVILALSNLGTSFASAILAKDATTNDKDELVSKATGEVLATGKSVQTFEGVPPNDVSGRKLCVTTTGGGKPETTCEAYSSDFTMMHECDALTMLVECKKNRLVKLSHTFGEGEKAQTYERTVCNPDWDCTNIYYGPNNAPTTADLCVGGTGPETVYVRAHPLVRGVDCHSSFYTISTSLSDIAATSDAFTSNEFELCNTDGDCDSGLSCEPDIAVVDIALPCPENSCDSVGSQFACYDANANDDGTNICSECSLGDPSTCDPTSSKPICTNVGGPAMCGCNGPDDCPIGETCAAPSCEEGTPKFCAAEGDHDAECTSSCRQKPTVDMTCTVDVGEGEDPNTVCADGLFCQLFEGTCRDKIAQLTGVCKDPNDVSLSCPTSPDASCVKGCDDVVYNHHDCAQANSVSVLEKTACPGQGGLTVCGGVVCGVDQFCKNDSCGGESSGTCTTTGLNCIAPYEPVCGCDGTTYGHECYADQAGVNIVSQGAC